MNRLLVTLLAVPLFAPLAGAQEYPAIGKIVRLKPECDALLPADATLELLAEGFDWTEGPVWVPRDGGYLLFTDIPPNRILRWSEADGLSIYSQGEKDAGPSTNGMVLAPDGALTRCDQRYRQVTKAPWGDSEHALTDNYRGKKFNSPNDAIWSARGDLYFTDPPYGIKGGVDSELRELDICGVYRLSAEGELSLVDETLPRPNGIGLSPDGQTLYVAQSAPEAPILHSYPVAKDGSVGRGRLFYDATELMQQGLRGVPDGMAVDTAGNVWASGPGGVLILSPSGELLGRIETGEITANCCFGGPDGTTLYITADRLICRVQTTVAGHFVSDK